MTLAQTLLSEVRINGDNKKLEYTVERKEVGRFKSIAHHFASSLREDVNNAKDSAICSEWCDFEILTEEKASEESS